MYLLVHIERGPFACHGKFSVEIATHEARDAGVTVDAIKEPVSRGLPCQ
jgi:hypothetical protein